MTWVDFGRNPSAWSGNGSRGRDRWTAHPVPRRYRPSSPDKSIRCRPGIRPTSPDGKPAEVSTPRQRGNKKELPSFLSLLRTPFRGFLRPPRATRPRGWPTHFPPFCLKTPYVGTGGNYCLRWARFSISLKPSLKHAAATERRSVGRSIFLVRMGSDSTARRPKGARKDGKRGFPRAPPM